MFDNVINLNKYIKPQIKENFGVVEGGNETSSSSSTKVTKNFENNQKINHSMMVDSITKLVNNVSSDVMQKNSATAASAAGASNSLNLMAIECDTVTISNVNQGAQSTNQTTVKTSQSNTSTISNDISTNIDKTIEKVGSTDLEALESANTKQLNDFMGSMPGYDPNKAQKLSSQCPDDSASLFSTGNKCKTNSSYELDATVKQSLELDESFKINDQDDISNEIQTKLDQANFASCQASSTASNQIALQKVKCKDMKISDIEQQAIANLYMECVFDQKNVSEITNKITNKISKKYNQIYDAVNAKGAEKGQAWLDEKMKIVDALAGAGVEKIMAAAGNLPPATNTTSKLPEVKADSMKSGGPTTDKVPEMIAKPNSGPIKFANLSPEQQAELEKSNQVSKPVKYSLFANPYILYGTIGFIILIILIILIVILTNSPDDSNTDADDSNADE